MSIFEYKAFEGCDRFLEISEACELLVEGSIDDLVLPALFADLPEAMTQEATLYIFENSIIHQSKVLLSFVQAHGLSDIPEIKNNLEVALLIRDTLFKSIDIKDSGHYEILKETAREFGEMFAINSMSAVYSEDFARVRWKSKLSPTGSQKIHSYTENLKLLISICGKSATSSNNVGNIGIKALYDEIDNVSFDVGFNNHLKLLSKFKFNGITHMIGILDNDDLQRGEMIGMQIDSAVRDNLTNLVSSASNCLRRALRVRTASTISSMLSMTEIDLCSFISSSCLRTYISSHWIDVANVDSLSDPNLVNLINLFNRRLCANPFFTSAISIDGYINKPYNPGIPLALIYPLMKDMDVCITIKDHGTGIASFSKAISLLNDQVIHPEVVQAGRGLIESIMDLKMRKLYQSLWRDPVIGLKMKQPGNVDTSYQFRFAAVWLCAALHNPEVDDSPDKTLTPIYENIGWVDVFLKNKTMLLVFVKSYDEATILDSLEHYQAGIKPLIELGALSRKHLALLPHKERGNFLQQDLGM